jgi:hypothetical protein
MEKGLNTHRKIEKTATCGASPFYLSPNVTRFRRINGGTCSVCVCVEEIRNVYKILMDRSEPNERSYMMDLRVGGRMILRLI